MPPGHSLACGELRVRGADVVSALDVGMAGRAREHQLEWAAANGRTLYSFNRGGFLRLAHAVGCAEAGPILA